jgi:hypothetical protein
MLLGACCDFKMPVVLCMEWGVMAALPHGMSSGIVARVFVLC